MGIDKLEIEILEDGTIKVTTDAISGVNHMSAEQFMQFMATETGGEVVRQKRKNSGLTHTHTNRKKQTQ